MMRCMSTLQTRAQVARHLTVSHAGWLDTAACWLQDMRGLQGRACFMPIGRMHQRPPYPGAKG